MTEWPGARDELGRELSGIQKVQRYLKANDPLPLPPRVPSDGRNPPLETYPVLLAPQVLTIVDGPDKALQKFVRCHFNSGVQRDLRDAWLWAVPSDPYKARSGELRRITNTGFWRRDAVVFSLLPGGSKKITVCCETGLTDTASQTLSASLGVKIPIGGLVELGAKLTGTLNRSITVTRNRKEEQADELANKTNRTRRCAVWHRLERVQVEVLVSPASTIDASNTGTDGRNSYSFGWKLIADESFEPSFYYDITDDS